MSHSCVTSDRLWCGVSPGVGPGPGGRPVQGRAGDDGEAVVSPSSPLPPPLLGPGAACRPLRRGRRGQLRDGRTDGRTESEG